MCVSVGMGRSKPRTGAGKVAEMSRPAGGSLPETGTFVSTPGARLAGPGSGILGGARAGKRRAGSAASPRGPSGEPRGRARSAVAGVQAPPGVRTARPGRDALRPAKPCEGSAHPQPGVGTRPGAAAPAKLVPGSGGGCALRDRRARCPRPGAAWLAPGGNRGWSGRRWRRWRRGAQALDSQEPRVPPVLGSAPRTRARAGCKVEDRCPPGRRGADPSTHPRAPRSQALAPQFPSRGTCPRPRPGLPAGAPCPSASGQVPRHRGAGARRGVPRKAQKITMPWTRWVLADLLNSVLFSLSFPDADSTNCPSPCPSRRRRPFISVPLLPRGSTSPK